MLRVKDFYQKIDQIAPFKTAYEWDNSGLLIGDMDAHVKKVLFTLDITDQIVDYAVANKFDLIIAHHPVILFQPVKQITQKKLLVLIENKIAVICAHTNLDTTKYGVNHVLANKLSLKNIHTLSMSDITQYQICVYTPNDYVTKVMQVMHTAGAGIIGNYSHCVTYFDTKGQYKPTEGATPFKGKVENLENVNEVKLELMCEDIHLNKVLKAMFTSHPYETPAYTVIPLKQKSPNYGIGCYGSLESHMSLKSFALYVKERLSAPIVKLWAADKKEDDIVKNIAVCGGSGYSVINEAKKVADVFVSGDFTYHQFLDSPMPVIDAGHYYTEYPAMPALKDLLSDFDCEMAVLPTAEHDIQKKTII